MSEMVNHPDHYAKGRKYEPYKVIKDDKIEDLAKAIQYLHFEIEAIKEGSDHEKSS